MSTADYPDWGGEHALAALLAAGTVSGNPGGIPLLLRPVTIINQLAPLTVNASNNRFFGPFTVNQPSYDIGFSLHTSSGVAIINQIIMEWSDSMSGLIVERNTWYVWAGTVANPHVIRGSGPCAGNTLSVTINNLNPVNGETLDNITLLGTSQLRGRHDWRTDDANNTGFDIPTFTATTPDMESSLIASSAISVGAGATATRALPLYSGAAWMHAETTKLDASARMTVQNITGAAGGLPYVDVATVTTSAVDGRANSLIFMPRAECQLLLHNADAGVQTLKVMLIVAEQPV